MLQKVAFTMYPVTDMPRARSFYEQVLGLGPSSNGASSPWVEFDLPGGGCLAITTVSQSQPSANAGGTIAFEVEDFDRPITDIRRCRWDVRKVPTADQISATASAPRMFI